MYRIGIDPSWYPLNLGLDEASIDAFVRDLFLEISKEKKVDFAFVNLDHDILFLSLQTNIEACLTSLYPYNFNSAKYDFSPKILSLSPVLIMPTSSKIKDIEGLYDKPVGVVLGSEGERILESYPKIVLHSYLSIEEALNKLGEQVDEAAVLDRFPTLSYVQNLYSTQLKISPHTFNEEGLRLVLMKNKQTSLFMLVTDALHELEKSGRLQQLQIKWGLDLPSRK